MSLIAFPFARPKRAAIVAAWLTLMLASLPAHAQAPAASPATPAEQQGAPATPAQQQAAPPAEPAKAGATIQHIVVEGAQRVEPATVLSYVSLREGEPYDEAATDRSLKTLFATGLFADVKFSWDGATLTIHVVENPIINQVVFEGNDKVSDKDLNKEVQEKPRTVFTRAKVQADVQRIIELYRRNGKFAANV
ncbi:MAG TPA: POTRA domain-containing protein, partial [Rhizomicrobium sp.]